jgi:hypothetical protein
MNLRTGWYVHRHDDERHRSRRRHRRLFGFGQEAAAIAGVNRWSACMRAILSILVAISVSGCSSSWPLAVIPERGGVMRGSATQPTFGKNTFEFSDQKTTCRGTFEPVPAGSTISLAFSCDDGRSGLGQGRRDVGSKTGSGTFRFSDGTTANFVWGETAAGI